MPNKSDSPAPINGVVENKENISQIDDFVNTQYMQELNEKYLTAVKTGDMEAAQKYVDEAAQRAGYTICCCKYGKW